MSVSLTDRNGRTILPGVRVRTEGGEGVVRRIEPEYGVLTIIVEERGGKSERMVRAESVEVIEAAR